MKTVELSKAYNPKDFEDAVYESWKKNELFKPEDTDNGKPPFVIVIPPPNVTGVLHMGHGLNNSLQDILIRFYRMMGNPTLWLPGTDHAGIATQNVVDRQLKAKGIDRHEIGRERFLEETWKVKENHHTIIKSQLEKIGASCDWSRERFTLDEGLSKAVREVFVSLYEKGLIYKGNYLVNWCSSCGTALADDEVEHREVPAKLYKVHYPYADGSGFIEIATTRPETMLGDTAVAVNPEDDRYKGLVGKKVILPIADREIPIIADSYVSMEFGTGMVKITPAHDPNDYEIAERHNLPKINILNPDGTLNNDVPEKYRNMDVVSARKRIVEELESLGLFIGSEKHTHQVGHCYRCNTVIEPYLSDQWFVRMKSMADKALKALEDDDIRFYPKRWENTYIHWLKNIRDWCISRQLWWGHRIPVWYCRDCGETIVSREEVTQCSKCGSSNLHQEEDVLDTWFSSWLWPFSTLGWPEETEDLKEFFPTTTLVTGYDIIFFWVARMIMASLEFMDQVPFRDIYITGLVRDKQGQKMSKSLGNGIDPLDVVDKYGADAMKFTLCFLSNQGQDVLIDMNTFNLGSKFANKIWNAARYILMNLEGRELLSKEELKLNDFDNWIYHQLNEAAGKVEESIKLYKFNIAGQAVYEYFWNDFCDWYLELTKGSLQGEDVDEKNRAITVLLDILQKSLRLLHPFVPFISEEIYQKMPNTEGFLITADYPAWNESCQNKVLAENMAAFQDVIKAVRTLRSEFTIQPEKKVPVGIRMNTSFNAKDFFLKHQAQIKKFMRAEPLSVGFEIKDISGSVPAPGLGYEAFVYIRDMIDIPSEIQKLKKEYDKLAKQLAGVEKKLANEKFLKNAPEEVIEKENGKKREFSERIEKVKKYLADLKK
ncbi:MAG: valine--tRNA ligase [Spirochaetia bacterium]|nr:valine--tRNA ligase [Spirochaetia bacterium]MCF7952472.1 valine--tRNA ligase [Spirochaetales bacterium]